MAVHIGCGSWADPEYVGVLYPPGLPAKQRLQGYAQHFDHVEVNASYYATPKAAATANWLKQTPESFGFTVKLHRAFSQSPEKTARDGTLVPRLLDGVAPLVEAKRLRAFLLVLPASFEPERHGLHELNTLAEKLAPHPLAVELRHNAWVKDKRRDETMGHFRSARIVWVAVDMPKIPGSHVMPVVDEVTDPRLAYLRLHGRNPSYLEAKNAEEGHTYAYTPRELKSIAARVEELAARAENVHVIANNHARDYAPKTALALQRLLGAGTDGLTRSVGSHQDVSPRIRA